MAIDLMMTSLAVTGEGHAMRSFAEQVYHYLHYIALFIGIAGVGILVWGVVTGVLLFIKTEAKAIIGEVHEDDRERLRHHLGYYLLLGLEVLIAADIVESIAAPTMDKLALLGAVVVIRTVISVSLNWELDKDKRNRLVLMSGHQATGSETSSQKTGSNNG